MSTQIKIIPTNNSKISELDFDNLPFGKVFTDHIFSADFEDGEWKNCVIKKLEPLQVHPGNMAWHYGQSIFEGMKATRDSAGTPLLFRPEMHAKRINDSATRMCMPTIPEDLFISAVNKLVALEKDWIPPAEGSALYIRPLMFATDEFIGVRPAENYKFLIMTLPVGPYYDRPVKLKAETTYVRAANGGVGEAKTAGNYAASLYPAMLAKKEGYDQVLWLDAKEFKYVQEVGTMNLMFVIDGKIITPKPDGSILKGITKNSILTILRDEGYEIEERLLSIDEICDAYDSGKLQEVFGTGTAAVVAIVNEINYKGKIMELSQDTYKVAPFVKNRINAIRARKHEDKFSWLHEAQLEMEPA
jgi:branched-chain amino acid aminotransferase